MKRIAAAFGLAVLVAGCGGSGGHPTAENRVPASVALQVDTSAPDRALKSYWAVLDAVRAYNHAEQQRLAQARHLQSLVGMAVLANDRQRG